MVLQIIVAGTLKLPCGQASRVKSKRLRKRVGVLDFVFDLVALNRLVAQRAELARFVTAPHP